jgi:hypothetical protein
MITETILEGVEAGLQPVVCNREIYRDEAVSGTHEFLLFIKPELLVPTPTIQKEAIVSMILERIAHFGLGIRNIRVLSADYLGTYGIIASHYGVINQLASNAREFVSETGRTRFEALFGEAFDSARVLGGLEFLEAFPCFNAQSLDYLWQNGKFEKLAGGTYALPVRLDGQQIYLVNGFHPRQLTHFTASGRCIVAMTLVGDCPWKTARSELIGHTCPAEAALGSIRRELLERVEEFGLAAVTPSWNGVHLSAGPVEGLVELMRYQSDNASGNVLQPMDFEFGRRMIEVLGLEKTQRLLANPTVLHEQRKVSVFDLTEEQDADIAMRLLTDIVVP